MNIENFKPLKFTLEEIFEKQKQLMFMYLPDTKEILKNFDIDTLEDQEVFKKFCWVITEELMEALEDEQNQSHLQEEVIDAFNFLIELYIMYGFGPNDLPILSVKSNIGLSESILNVVYQLGITANLLKNRKWRKSNYMVDLLMFESRFKQIWGIFFGIFKALQMNLDDVISIWSLKYQVNLFRIESNY